MTRQDDSRSRHLVDATLLPGLELMPAIDLSADSLPATRQRIEQMAAVEPDNLDVALSVETIAGGDGQDMALRLLIPADRRQLRGAVLVIHGGGYVMGTASIGEARHRVLAAATGAIFASVEYRLAPETPYPGPVEDCYAALCWLHDNAARLDIDIERIAVMGASAGGGLAAALALLARDRGGPAISHQHLIYPMLDDRTGVSDEPHPYAGEFVWTPASNRFGWGALLGQDPGGEGVSHYAAPARAENLSGLPPAFIATGALDLFVDENLDYGRRLLRAGVPVELHLYPGAYHGFDLNVGAPVVAALERDSATALARAID